MVSKRDNIATHHLYQAWDPVPSLSPATTGKCWGWGGMSDFLDLKTREDILRNSFEIQFAGIEAIFVSTFLCMF